MASKDLTTRDDEIKLLEQNEKILNENDLLKDILCGAKLTISIDQREREIVFGDLFRRHNSLSLYQSNVEKQVNTVVTETLIKEDGLSSNARVEDKERDRILPSEGGLERIVEMSHDSQYSKDDVPKFYKKDILAVLEEKNTLKEQISSLEEELEEWKRAAIETQEKLNKAESQLLKGYGYPTELEANTIGLLPKGVDFRPQPQSETVDVFVTDVEVIGHAQQNQKFVFAIQITWSDKRRFEIYRRYGEFFTFQNTLLLLFPAEAGKQKSSKRIIPSLPTADNVLAILGATNSKNAVESRLQLISDYCTTILLQLPPKISKSIFVKDFFKPRPGDKQLEGLQRPRKHTLEMSVYPLLPEGASLDIYIAIADFNPSSDTKSCQMPLKAHDTVQVALKNDSGWWFVYKNEGDECGYVPASFLKKIGDPEAPMSPTDTRDILGFVFSLTHDQEATPTVAPVLSYTALDNYETDDTRQLSFPIGAVLTIIEKSEDGWWLASYNNQSGWVPSTYLEPQSQDSSNNMEESLILGQIYITTQNYTAKDEDEISLPSGVKVEVIEKSLHGWWRVKYKKKSGYAPAVILKPPDNEECSIIDTESSLTQILSHSISGIKRPPPRRKFLMETIEKRRASTFITPITEENEGEQHASLQSTLDKRRQSTSSIKDWFHNLRGANFRSKSNSMTKERTKEDNTIENTKVVLIPSVSDKGPPKLIAQPRPRSWHISQIEYKKEDKGDEED